MHNAMSNYLSVFDFVIFYDIHCRLHTDATVDDCASVSLLFVNTVAFRFQSSSPFCRSVSEEERSFALGMQFVIFRLFGYIPAPIIFGSLIDSTCLLWQSTCGEKGGRCLIYDIETFRYK